MDLNPGAAAALGLDRLGLDELLARCDLVTLHVPLLPSTSPRRLTRRCSRCRRRSPTGCCSPRTSPGVAYEAAQALYSQAWDNVRRVLGMGDGA